MKSAFIVLRLQHRYVQWRHRDHAVHDRKPLNPNVFFRGIAHNVNMLLVSYCMNKDSRFPWGNIVTLGTSRVGEIAIG